METTKTSRLTKLDALVDYLRFKRKEELEEQKKSIPMHFETVIGEKIIDLDKLIDEIL